MAIIETIIDDMDESPDATTREFSFDGVDYQIDLVDKNFAKMMKVLQPYIEAASPTKKTRAKRSATSTPATRTTRTATNGEGSLQDIREWARANGRKVSDRGRPAKEVMDAYQKAHFKQAMKNGSPALANA